MIKLIKWIYEPSGNCPVQSEGYFLNYFFYFRSRGECATIEFYDKKEDFDFDTYTFRSILKKTAQYQAGYLSKKECKRLILKGCFFFILKITKDYAKIIFRIKESA